MSKETKKKVAGAFDAMNNLGIPVDKVKPVLKNLLKLYDKNWELIEAENYRALADAIFESEEAEAAEHSKKNVNEKEDYLEEDATEEPERPLKRLRLRYQEGLKSSINNSSVPGTPLIIPKEEPDVLPDNQPLNLNQSQSKVESSQPTPGNTIVKSQDGMFQSLGKNKGKQPISSNSSMVHESCDPCQPSDSQRLKNIPLRIEFKSPSHPMQLLDKGKSSFSPIPEKGSVSDNSMVTVHLKEPNIEPDTFQSLKRKNIENHVSITYHPSASDSANGPFPPDERAENGNHAMISDICSSNLEIASSPCGEVKILLNGDLALRKPDFRMPGLEAVLKSVEDNFLRSYKTVDPKISLRNIMQEMCECVLRFGTESTNESSEATGVTPARELLKNCSGIVDSQFGAEIILPKMLLLPSYDGLGEGLQPNEVGSGVDHVTNGELQDNDIEGDSSLMVDKEYLLTREGIMSLYDAIDISKGQEKVAITLVNGFNNESAPSFCYITQNALFQNAHVNFTLAGIGENKCCSACFGDCLLSSTPCACGFETGGEFAYTLDGLVKEDFLNECISMSRDPKKNYQFFCKLCPLQKSINLDVTEPCKGHLMRKFIKECWWKCGCNKQCGNRVVQRGITYRIQVFTTGEGKGWGLRTLEDIPKGAFVCEYVGEVLTNSELFDRVSRIPQGMKHSYPVLLDAGWGSKGVLKDEEALYLDATCYGNVARFINHRCSDSNLVSIPVEIETPDHHYYHLALFTTRNVKAMEELTCDYQMDFDDNDHPIEAFQCLCDSEFCHSIKR